MVRGRFDRRVDEHKSGLRRACVAGAQSRWPHASRLDRFESRVAQPRRAPIEGGAKALVRPNRPTESPMVSAFSLGPPPARSLSGRGWPRSGRRRSVADALGRPARSRCTEPSAEPAASGAVGELCGPIELQVRRLHIHIKLLNTQVLGCEVSNSVPSYRGSPF